MSQEFSIAHAKASVMVYDEKMKKWVPSGGMNGFAKVHIYQHATNSTFRIVGRLLQDHSVVINTALVKGLRYNVATPTFHQWRDQRQVYGLNFAVKQEADEFGKAALGALEQLASGQVAPPPQVSGNIHRSQQERDEVAQRQKDTEEQRQREVEMLRQRREEIRQREEEQKRMEIEAELKRQEELRKQREAEEKARQERVEKERIERELQVERERTLEQERELEKLQREMEEQEADLRRESELLHQSAMAEQVRQVERRPNRGPPPAAPERKSSVPPEDNVQNGASPPPSAPPGPPPPPPVSEPPPPPALPIISPHTGPSVHAGGSSLGAALANVQLKSSVDTGRDSAPAGGSLSVMDEMAAKLAKRRAKDNGGSVSQDVVDSPVRQTSPKPPGPSTAGGDSGLSALLAKRRLASERESPSFDAATADSLASVAGQKAGPGTAPKPGKPKQTPKTEDSGERLSSNQLQLLKSELLGEFRKELEAFKSDIVAAVRREISSALNK